MSDIFGFPDEPPPEEDPYDLEGILDQLFGGGGGGDEPPTDDFTRIWWGDEQPASWWDDRRGVVLDGDYGERALTGRQWYEQLTNLDAEDFLATYGMTHQEAIHQMIDDFGIWEPEDWETWREQYLAAHGVSV